MPSRVQGQAMTDDISPVYGYLKQPSMVDYPGFLAVVMFTSGCNFRCGFCHNAELLSGQQAGIPWMQLKEACSGFRANWVDGAVITGGEPTLKTNLPELINFLKGQGFKVKLDTNGSNPRMLQRIIALVDYVAMDIKCSLERYQELTGYNETATLKESINIIRSSATSYEFRTTVIEKFHDDGEILRMRELISGCKRYVIQPFLPRDNLPDAALCQQKRTSPDHLRQVANLVSDYVEQLEIRAA